MKSTLAVLAAAILLLLAAALLASSWINRDAGKREIDAAFARVTGGSATYERIDFNFLPLPGAVVSRPRISMADIGEMHAESMTVRFDVLALLAGRVRLRSMQVSEPRVLLEFPAPRDGGKPFDASGMEQQVRAALGQVARLVPGAALVVDDGRVDVRIGGRTALELRKVDFRFDSASGKLAVDLSCSGNLWAQLKLAGSLSATDLSGEGRAEVSGLRAGDLGAALGLSGQWPVAEALADATVQWKMAGPGNLNASASVASRAAVLQGGQQRVPVEGLSAELAFESDDDFTRWTVRRLKLDAPRLSVGWTLTQRADAAELQLDASDSDIVTLRELDRLDLLAPGSGHARLEAGTIRTLSLRTRAPSVDRLFELPNLEIRGDFEDARLFLPDYALALDGVRASVMTSGGSWVMEKVEARLGRTSMREGRLAGKFSVVPQPLHVDAQLRVDLAEAHELAKRLVREPQARAQLERIRDLQGTAQLRMVLGETLERLEADLEIASIQLAARHAAVALPIRISSGKLGYRKRELRFDAVDGALGNSTLAGVTGRLQFAGPGRIDLQRADAELAVDELFASLKGREDLAALLKPLRSLGGAASLSLTQLDGNLGEPGTLLYRASVLPRRLSIDMPEFAPPVMLDGGKILITQKDLEFQSVKATSLDAALTLTGQAGDYRNGALALRGKADGVVGERALFWAEERAGIPRELHLVPPLAIEGVEANWVRGGDMSASGKLDFAGGPVVRFAAARAGERLDVRNLGVRDAASDATFSGSFSGTRAQAGFKGKLVAATVHRIFSHHRFDGVEIEGDLQAQGDIDEPLKASVTGRLRGSGVPVSAGIEPPVMLERFSVNADGDTLRIDSARLESDGNHVDLSGQVRREPGGYAVDIDVRGDEVTIRDSASEGDEERARGEIPESGKLLDRLAATQVSGRIAVDFRKVRFGKFEIAPLVAVGRHLHRRADLQITQAALCGISMEGTATLLHKGVSLQATLSARDQPIGESVACLTDRHVRMSGNFDFDAQLSAEGEIHGIARALRGNFSLAARNGRIQQSDTLNTVFGALNVTSLAAGRLPDLRQSGMGYSKARLRGTVDGTRIAVDEFALNADSVAVAAQGSMDFAKDRIEATVLVAPLPRVNWIVSKIPILGRIFGTTVLAMPVRVSGTLDNPVVVPLGPEAVAARFTEILSNTLTLPGAIVRVVPGVDQRSGPAPRR